MTTLSQPVTIYIDYISQPARSVASFCRLAKIPHKIQEVRVFQSQHMTDNYAKINPVQKIPALQDGDLKIGESTTILRYLADSKAVEEHWYPRNDLRKRAIIDMYLDWHHNNTRKCTRYLIASKYPEHPYMTIYHIKADQEEKIVKATFKKIESVFLKDQKYIGGDLMSIADLSAFCEIVHLRLMDFDFSPYPVLSKWMDRCLENEIIREVHTVLFKMIAKSKQPKI